MGRICAGKALSIASRAEAIIEKAYGKDQAEIRYVEHFETGGDAVLKSACRMSLEGIVSKQADAPYASGRSDSWTKAKCRAGHEVVIGGWNSNGSQFRSLMAGVYRGDHLVYVGNVGTGFGADKVSRLMPALKAAASETNPFGGKDAPRKKAGMHWLKPELVAEIEFAGFTGAGMIRQAAFKGLRQDKPAKEVEAEATGTVRSARDRRANSQTREDTTRDIIVGSADGVVMGVALSRPDKILWPDEGQGAVTKLDLALYFERCRRLDDGASERPPMLDHQGARRYRGTALLSASFDEGRVQPSRGGLLSGDRKPYVQIDRDRGSGRRGPKRRRRTASLEQPAGRASPARPSRLRPGSRAGRRFRGRHRRRKGNARPARRARSCVILQDDRRQGSACRDAACPRRKRDKSSTWAEAKQFARDVCSQMAATVRTAI